MPTLYHPVNNAQGLKGRQLINLLQQKNEVKTSDRYDTLPNSWAFTPLKNIKKKDYRQQKGKEGTFTREKEKKPDNTKGKEDSLVVKIRGFGTW